MLATARKARSVQIRGEALARLRDSWQLTQDDFAKRIGRSRSWVQMHESTGPHRIDRTVLAAIAAVAGTSPDRVFRLLKDRSANPERLGLEIVSSGNRMPAAFNLGIAASGWVELRGEGRTAVPSAPGGFVIVRVTGDSMEPKWADGEQVMFQLLDSGEDAPMVGRDYFFIRHDGYGTFKRLLAIEGEQFVLAARNDKYSQKLRVSRQEAVMIAEAMWEVREKEGD